MVTAALRRLEALTEALVGPVAAAPAGAAPIDLVTAALGSVGAIFDGRHDHSRRRQAIIDATPELQERELIKLATLATTLAAALRDRGIPEPAASLTSQAAMAVFRVAFERWVRDPGEPDLPAIIRASFADLRTLIAGPPAKAHT
ncbi:TetR family transcriptional regulator [Asanoa sp. WMMD1127]|uniref:acyl-CoA-like ligand-binding transcription factor n=1 Tax=Asanoa sp. WMMD1127 TaxID=3016107 RepID=UPI0024169F7B|nr:TetR family transcriptional regulator [Asanoa sp. WMMD1127]MDG4825756.1 TetR family transcriptional regulator [Asanoa sp. WMMD1127]